MHIFIDESGGFIVPPAPRPAMCCVAALAVPDSSVDRLNALHSRLIADWRPTGNELKGRDLSERNFRRIFDSLHHLDALAVVVAIDMGLQSDAHVTAHRLAQAERLRENVSGEEHLPSMREEVHALAARIAAQSNQLYVQSHVQTYAIDRMLRIGTLHYAQTEPASLGSFVWRVDAKDKTIQECESLWATMEKPYLQTMFIRDPHLFVNGAGFDYSAMDRFHNPPATAPPAHLAAASRHREGEPYLTSDLRPLLDDLAFVDSRSSPGIQFADVVASAYCRACNGRLGTRGWDRLGRLMVKRPEDRQAVAYLDLSASTPLPRPARQPYGPVVQQLELDARSWDTRARA